MTKSRLEGGIISLVVPDREKCPGCLTRHESQARASEVSRRSGQSQQVGKHGRNCIVRVQDARNTCNRRSWEYRRRTVTRVAFHTMAEELEGRIKTVGLRKLLARSVQKRGSGAGGAGEGWDPALRLMCRLT